MKTTKMLTQMLVKKFAGRKFASCYRRNKKPSEGWSVPGNCKWTNAVKASNLPWNYFWSGSNPTPSTQYPTVIANYLSKIDKR